MDALEKKEMEDLSAAISIALISHSSNGPLQTPKSMEHARQLAPYAGKILDRLVKQSDHRNMITSLLMLAASIIRLPNEEHDKLDPGVSHNIKQLLSLLSLDTAGWPTKDGEAIMADFEVQSPTVH